MSEEHKAKMQAGRALYQAKARAQRALITSVPKKPLEGTIYEQQDEIELVPIQGRPKAKGMSEARESVMEKIFKKKDKLIDAQIDLATGLYYLTADGTHVYQKAPNPGTGEFLINQLIGRPKETIDVQTEVRINVDI